MTGVIGRVRCRAGQSPGHDKRLRAEIRSLRTQQRAYEIHDDGQRFLRSEDRCTDWTDDRFRRTS